MTDSIEKHPDKDELELTLLGPGYGESVVIHIGNDQWIVVDSCTNENNLCAPLEYFKKIGVDPLNVVLVIASHWHDDHVKGLSRLVEECQNAKFCCAMALTKDEFKANIARFGSNQISKWTSGVDELYKTFSLLSQKTSPSYAVRATCNKRLFRTQIDAHHICEVWSLSPSEKENELFIKEIGNLSPIAGDSNRRMPITRNNLSVVIHISIGSNVFLLGSDLEETKDAHTGWSIIADSDEKPQEKSIIFKIPHHGSSNGHSQIVWDKMIDEDAYAILTPYNRGRKKLPSLSDIDRIAQLNNRSYSTIQSLSGSTRKRSNTVEKIIKDSVLGFRNISYTVGMLRLRKKIEARKDQWKIQLFNGACNIKDMKH